MCAEIVLKVAGCKVSNGLCLTHGFSVSRKVSCPSFLGDGADWEQAWNDAIQGPWE